MFNRKRNPMRKFGLRPKDVGKYNTFHTIQYGDIFELMKEAKRLNHQCKKINLNDRIYYTLPIAGMTNAGILIVAHN